MVKGCIGDVNTAGLVCDVDLQQGTCMSIAKGEVSQVTFVKRDYYKFC